MTEETTPNREQLEADANVLREHIAQNLESLDQRRHDAFNVKTQVVRHPLTSVLLGAGTLLAVAGGGSALVLRAQKRKQSRLRDGIAALSRAWHHPERVAQAHAGGSIGEEVIRGLVVSVATFVGAQLAKHALQKFLPELFEEHHDVATR